MNNSEIVYLEIPYNKKDYCKVLGAKWDSKNKKWYCDSGCKILIDEFSIFYLDIPYEKKEYAKERGCKWDIEKKRWFTYNSNHELINDYCVI